MGGKRFDLGAKEIYNRFGELAQWSTIDDRREADDMTPVVRRRWRRGGQANPPFSLRGNLLNPGTWSWRIRPHSSHLA